MFGDQCNNSAMSGKRKKKRKKSQDKQRQKNGVAIFGKGFNSIFVLDKKGSIFFRQNLFHSF